LSRRFSTLSRRESSLIVSRFNITVAEAGRGSRRREAVTDRRSNPWPPLHWPALAGEEQQLEVVAERMRRPASARRTNDGHRRCRLLRYVRRKRLGVNSGDRRLMSRLDLLRWRRRVAHCGRLLRGDGSLCESLRMDDVHREAVHDADNTCDERILSFSGAKGYGDH